MPVILPKHACSCTIVHNDHKDSYETVEQYVKFDITEWGSRKDYDIACETNELWCIQWYPNTPVASIRFYASSFIGLMELLLSEKCELEEYN